MANNHEMEEIRRIVNKVQDFAEKHKYAYLVPEQMLYVLLSDDKCVNLIKSLTTDRSKNKAVSDLKKEVSEYIEENVEKAEDIGGISMTKSYQKLLNDAVTQASLRSIEPDSFCIFVMLFNDKEQASAYFLSQHGIFEEDVLEYIRNYRDGGGNADGNGSTENLAKYSVNLTQMARDGKIDPLIGREKEIERIADILAKKRGSCPVLCGEAGCVEANTLIRIRKIS